ncbi:MAG TPA: FAD-dependent oxidoreductase [Candidatus Pullichristensenella avicola]|nr:FAD-dependent oxidoreductase [Candidatus Pullichristensenella avicola]
MERKIDIVIIGGGPAGLAAALSARERAPEASVLILERDRALGGILQQCIHNGFGLHYFGEELTGPEYVDRFIRRLEGKNIEVWLDTMVLEIGEGRRVVCVSAERGLVALNAGAVVLAMGCRERPRGALIPGTRPAGVYTAGTAQRLNNIDGYLPGKRIVILGSGDIGLIMARRMTWEGAKVELVAEIMPYSSGLKRNIVQCLEDNDIPLLFNHTVTRVHGRERVEGVTVSEVDPATRLPIRGTARFVPCDTLLLSVGLIPENELSRGAGVEIDAVTGGAVVDERRQTSVGGIFACGNVLHVHDLVDNVSVEAAIAGQAAAEYALAGEKTAPQRAVQAGRGVRYVVPQRIRAGASGNLDLYFRVDNVYRGATLEVLCGEDVILRRKRPIVTPGEMEKIAIDLAAVTADVTVRLAADA